MNHKEYKDATNQQYNNPTEWNGKTKYCKICDIEESKTYFKEDTNICLDCFEQQQKEEETNKNY
jgi:hypothetical protein